MLKMHIFTYIGLSNFTSSLRNKFYQILRKDAMAVEICFRDYCFNTVSIFPLLITLCRRVLYDFAKYHVIHKFA